MANPRLIKKRVQSINNIGKITNALEKVSAAKVQKAQNMALNAKPYAKLIYELTGSISGKLKFTEIPLLRIPDRDMTELYVIVSTNRGLAGNINTSLFKFAANYLEGKKGVDCSFVTVGKKGRTFASLNGNLIADFSDEKNIENIVSSVTKMIIEGFTGEIYDNVYIIYSDFINALDYRARIKQILPISKISLAQELGREVFELGGESEIEGKLSITAKNYDYEPDAVTVLSSLLPFYLEIQIAESIYEALASEHSARMVAMKNATDNSQELSESLTLEFNKARQSLVTNEISEITTAQLSLEDKYE